MAETSRTFHDRSAVAFGGMPERAPGARVMTRSRWRTLLACGACMVAAALALPALAQPGQNIAGKYRGLMTECLTAPRLNVCRDGLMGIALLADDVDAKRATWERAGSAPGATHDEYAAALDRLNRSIVDFNRDMNPSPSGAN